AGQPRTLGSVHGPRAVIAKHVVGGALVLGRVTVVGLAVLAVTERGVDRVPPDVMADIQVEIAVVVKVGPGGRGGVLPGSGQARGSGGILEGPIAPIAGQDEPGQAGGKKGGTPPGLRCPPPRPHADPPLRRDPSVG